MSGRSVAASLVVGGLVLGNLVPGCGTESMPVPPDAGTTRMDATIRPETPESSCDAADDDGDGVVDEGFDLATDPDNCGSCGTSCGLPNGRAACVAGSCTDQLVGCDEGWVDCDSAASGCETELGTEAACSGCGDDCSRIANSMFACQAGACVQTGGCDAGWADCDGSPANGCETSLQTAEDCGACGVACDPAAAGGSCAGGSCTVASCDAGLADCNGDPGDGCEQRIDDDVLNCGLCMRGCNLADTDEVACVAGSCEVVTCSSGFADCDGDSRNGCEVGLDTITDCRSCGNECAWDNATGVCGAIGCVFGSCLPGFADCDSDESNGCETILGTASDCSRCGERCDGFANAVGVCGPARTCAMTICDPNYADCDADPSNGCETRLGTTTDCAGCGHVCDLPNAISGCNGGVCAVLGCDPGFADCPLRTDPGCQTPIDTITDCGGCGIACVPDHALGDCSTGICEVALCEPSWFDCDGNTGNGCEQYCSYQRAEATCSGGTCMMGACIGNYGDCNADPSDGCETYLRTNSNCGGCGVVCTGSASCCNGTCSTGSCGVT